MIQKRLLTSSSRLLSHIGAAPISIPAATTIAISTATEPRIVRKGPDSWELDRSVTVSGPRGSLSFLIPSFLSIENKDPAKLDIYNVNVTNPKDKLQKSMWGTVRSLLNNNIIGVNKGHVAKLRFVGTGYRAELDTKGNQIKCKVGHAVMQCVPIPKGVTVTVVQPTNVTIEGNDKQQVKLFAANVRKLHPPEPYKGKGIYVDDETIKLKTKKIK